MFEPRLFNQVIGISPRLNADNITTELAIEYLKDFLDGGEMNCCADEDRIVAEFCIKALQKEIEVP